MSKCANDHTKLPLVYQHSLVANSSLIRDLLGIKTLILRLKPPQMALKYIIKLVWSSIIKRVALLKLNYLQDTQTLQLNLIGNY